jgi:MYXO-CTERM domain-containing protein
MATTSVRALLALALAFGTPLALAQTGDTTTATRAEVEDDGGFDIGWVGLLGLIGLAGLRRKEPHPRGPVRPGETVR